MEWWVDLSAILRNLAIVAGGAFGLWLAWSRTRALNRQSTTNEESEVQRKREHLIEIFESAIDKLQNERMEVRLGAIYMLEEIIDLDPDRYGRATVDILAAYLRRQEAERQEGAQDYLVVAELLSAVQPSNEDANDATQ